MAQFPDVQKAVSAVQEILQSPQGPHIRTNLTLWSSCEEYELIFTVFRVRGAFR